MYPGTGDTGQMLGWGADLTGGWNPRGYAV